MMNRSWIGAAVAIAMLLAAGQATAQTAVDIGGKTSVSGLFSVTTVDPDEGDEVTALLLGGLGAYTTEDGRFEFGGGLTVIAALADFADFTVYSLSGQARINTDALGPEENVILYAGAIAGLGILDGDGNSAAEDLDDEVGQFGPKIGAEFYISPKTAIQVQEALLFDTEGGITNQFTIGFKVLFN